jgi:hypothetical protein
MKIFDQSSKRAAFDEVSALRYAFGVEPPDKATVKRFFS